LRMFSIPAFIRSIVAQSGGGNKPRVGVGAPEADRRRAQSTGAYGSVFGTT
jgi:hypothetical protein